VMCHSVGVESWRRRMTDGRATMMPWPMPGVRGRGAPVDGLEGTHSVAVLEVSGRAAVRWFSRKVVSSAGPLGLCRGRFVRVRPWETSFERGGFQRSMQARQARRSGTLIMDGLRGGGTRGYEDRSQSP